MTVPAGWYPDPMGLPQLRWWDNHSWTEFTSASRSPLIMQDAPPVAYAEDDMPTRRSQRGQQPSQASSTAQQPPMNKADLISTLRQLEPPKAQQIERNQPAPPSNPADEDDARQQAAQQPAAQQQAARNAQQRQQQQAQEQAQQQADAQARARQGFGQREQFQGYGSQQQDADPFAEFLRPEEPRSARSSVNYSDAPGFPQASGPTGYKGSEPDFGRQQHVDPNPGPSQQAQNEYARPERAQRRITDRSQPIYTPSVWAIALIPLIQMVVVLLGVSSGVKTVPIEIVIGLWVVPYALSIVLAYTDRKTLLQSGHQAPAHWGWAFLTSIAYLIARSMATNREFGKGMAPVLVWVSLAIIQALSVVAVPGIVIMAMPGVFQDQVEQSITEKFVISAHKLTVTCPTPAVQIGVQFVCTGVTADDAVVKINVSLQRANGWIDWRVDSQMWQSDSLNKQ